MRFFTLSLLGASLWLSFTLTAEAAVQPLGEDGCINNRYFGIFADGTNAESTTQGLTDALAWAAGQGMAQVKLERGRYAVDGSHENGGFISPRGVFFPSNIQLDLGGSTVFQVPCALPSYSIFCLYNVENVSIYGGVLMGDRETHDYSQPTPYPSHEFGFGIDVRGSRDIHLSDLSIYGMTGDAIILGGNDKALGSGGAVCENVTVEESRLYDCRRQGISVVGAQGVVIRQCSIFGIEGTDPQSGIDLEGELDWPVSGVEISGCNIINPRAVIFHRNSARNLCRDNYIEGTVSLVEGEGNCIIGNDFFGGDIVAQDTTKVRYTLISGNEMTEGSILLADSQDVVVQGNHIRQGQIALGRCSGAVLQNQLENSGGSLDFAIALTGRGVGAPALLCFADNHIEGRFGTPVIWNYKSGFHIVTDPQECQDYLTRLQKLREGVDGDGQTLSGVLSALVVNNLNGDHAVTRPRDWREWFTANRLYGFWLPGILGLAAALWIGERARRRKQKKRRREQRANHEKKRYRRMRVR